MYIGVISLLSRITPFVILNNKLILNFVQAPTNLGLVILVEKLLRHVKGF